MRSIEDKACCNNGAKQDISTGSGCSFEFHKGNGANRSSSHHRTALGKPTPSKWDDAQKWLVGLSRKGPDRHQWNAKPRNSNADDTRLIAPPVPQKEKPYSSSEDEGEGGEENACPDSATTVHSEVETKNVDCEESFWRISKPVQDSAMVMRSICVRDMGTEMTPIASQEPSRTATPIRATTPAARSPISSGSTTPVRCQHGTIQGYQTGLPSAQAAPLTRGRGPGTQCISVREESSICKTDENANSHSHSHSHSKEARKMNPLESRATAWDEAERAKYTARYKREEVKIQAWENHEKRKAEMEMRRMEVKAETLKTRAQERCANKLASTRRIAEERRASAEAQLNEKAMRTSERADYIRRTGHLPSSLSFKLPSFCW